MGTRFGGDGVNYFQLPDLRDKSPAKCRYMIVVEGDDPNFPKQDSFIGELMLLPYDRAFQSLWLCNGDLLPIQLNTLFSLLGDRFGGDGHRFALPDLRAAAPPKFNYYIAPHGLYPQRS